MMGGDDAVVDDDEHLARYVKRVITDPDAGEGAVFATWYAKMCRMGIRPDWESII